MKHLTQPHIQTLIEQENLATLMGEDVSVFFKALEDYRWHGLRIDSGKFQPSYVLTVFEPAKLEKLILQLKPKVSHLVLVYSQDEAIEGCVNTIISNLDELIWTAPGPRYIVGAIHDKDITLPHRGVILEYDGVETIRLWLSEIE